mmetsp:Transcript_22101/g.36421  ORF Transcript_22101/g.36421 Transcript_22101/m.36421 type:complete len:84 (-) Transcript_22101:1240-1491(-)
MRDQSSHFSIVTFLFFFSRDQSPVFSALIFWFPLKRDHRAAALFLGVSTYPQRDRIKTAASTITPYADPRRPPPVLAKQKDAP